MKFTNRILTLLIIFFSTYSYSSVGPTHVVGKITNITSISNGILVRVGANETPASLTITAWTLGRYVVVYTSPASSGYCQVTQVDPHES